MRLAYRFMNGILAVLLITALALAPRPVAAGRPEAARRDEIPELFDAPSGADLAPLAAPGSPKRRARTAPARPALLDEVQTALGRRQVPGPVALPLFADARVVARFEHVETALGSISTLAGKLDGYPLGEIHLSRSGNSFFASINTGGASYEVSSADGQSVQITQIDSASLPAEEDLIPPGQPTAAAAPAAPADALVGASTADDGSRIDVFVGYTTAARLADGGAAQIQNRIATAIAETNTGYANSGINQRVVLVGAAEYAYDETGFDWQTTLANWKSYAGVFAPAHTARDTLRADEMVLIVKDTGFCGLGYLMTVVSPSFSDYPFALVSRTCATGYYSFAHEMGHNMGAHHDQYSAAGAQGAYPYSYGYWIPNPANGGRFDYRTIMAYDTDSAYKYTSTRVNYWSNPNVILPQTNTATGAATANNALTLNNTAATVAQFRDGLAPAAPTSLTATAQGTAIQLSWGFSGSDIWKFRVERSDYGTGNWSEIGQTGPAVFTYSDTTIATNKSYSYRVIADNGNGRAASNEFNIPETPSNLVATLVSGTTYRLSWTDNSTNATGFLVERQPAAGGAWITLPQATASPIQDDPGVGEFRYRMRAVGIGGVYSFYSNFGYTLPNSPTNLTAAVVNQARVRLSWTDTSGIEAGFPIEASWNGGGWLLWVTAPASASASASYDVTELTCNTTYNFRLRAQNSAGFSATYATLGALISTSACVAPAWPDAPGATAAALGSYSIRLNWPNVDGETSYRVEQWINAGWVPLWSSPGPNITTYTVTGLRPATPYKFQVIAINSLAPSGAQNSIPVAINGATNPAIFLPRISK